MYFKILCENNLWRYEINYTTGLFLMGLLLNYYHFYKSNCLSSINNKNLYKSNSLYDIDIYYCQ